MIRIAHIKSFYGRVGGIESMLEGVLPALGSRQDVACRMILVSDSDDPAMEARLSGSGAVPLDRLTWRGLRHVSGTARDLARLLQDRGTEVIHTHDMRANLLAALVARKTGLPWIAHVHGWLGHTHSLGYRLYEGVDKLLIRMADHVLVGSYATLAELGPSTARRASVVWNAVPIPDIAAWQEGKPVQIVMLGRIHYGKGQDLLIEALARLKTVLDWQAVIVGVGDPKAEAELDALIRRHGLAPKVRRTGFVESTTPYLRASDIVVVTSRKESLPLTCLEGMAWAKAVVASEAGDLPRVVTDGLTGRVVPIDDVEALARTLDELVNDAALRRRLGIAARAHVTRYHTAESLAEGMVQTARGLVCRDAVQVS